MYNHPGEDPETYIIDKIEDVAFIPFVRKFCELHKIEEIMPGEIHLPSGKVCKMISGINEAGENKIIAIVHEEENESN